MMMGRSGLMPIPWILIDGGSFGCSDGRLLGVLLTRIGVENEQKFGQVVLLSLGFQS